MRLRSIEKRMQLQYNSQYIYVLGIFGTQSGCSPEMCERLKKDCESRNDLWSNLVKEYFAALGDACSDLNYTDWLTIETECESILYVIEYYHVPCIGPDDFTDPQDSPLIE